MFVTICSKLVCFNYKYTCILYLSHEYFMNLILRKQKYRSNFIYDLLYNISAALLFPLTG